MGIQNVARNGVVADQKITKSETGGKGDHVHCTSTLQFYSFKHNSLWNISFTTLGTFPLRTLLSILFIHLHAHPRQKSHQSRKQSLLLRILHNTIRHRNRMLSRTRHARIPSRTMDMDPLRHLPILHFTPFRSSLLHRRPPAADSSPSASMMSSPGSLASVSCTAARRGGTSSGSSCSSNPLGSEMPICINQQQPSDFQLGKNDLPQIRLLNWSRHLPTGPSYSRRYCPSIAHLDPSQRKDPPKASPQKKTLKDATW